MYYCSASSSSSSSSASSSSMAAQRRAGFNNITNNSSSSPSTTALPNVDVTDANFDSSAAAAAAQPDGYRDRQTEHTQQLEQDNKYYGNAFTDKFFNQDVDEGRSGAGVAPEYRALSGETVGGDYFRHNNMQPFFGSHVRGSTKEAGANESILDSYSGQGSQTITKDAIPPMFSLKEVGLPYGAADNNDFFQERVNPSWRMANVKPFDEVQVGPGLGLGFTSAGQGGFNSGMMHRESWMDKSVDDLRVNNKPKSSGTLLYGHEVPDSFIKNMAGLGEMNKNRVERSFEMGEDRLMTTTGVEKGPTLHAIPVDRYVSRPETTQSYTGGASVMHPKEYVLSEHVPSKHKDLAPLPVGIVAAGNRGNPKEEDFARKAARSYPNNRATSDAYGQAYFGPFGSVSIGAVVAPILDILRPSRKEDIIYENNLRPYQIAQPRTKNAYIYDPRESAPTTIRETTEKNSKNHLYMQAGAYGVGGYTTAEMQPVHNQRDTTNVAYVGAASAGEGSRQLRPYDAEYSQRNNHIKSSTIKGHMVPGHMSLFNDSGGGSVRTRTNTEKDMLVSRPLTVKYSQPPPSYDTLGRNASAAYEHPESYASTKLDRNNADDLLSQLKENPYTHDIRRSI